MDIDALGGNSTRKTIQSRNLQTRQIWTRLPHKPSAHHICCQRKHACPQHSTFQMRQNKPTIIKSVSQTNDDSWGLRDEGMCIWVGENMVTDFTSDAQKCSVILRSISGLRDAPKPAGSGQRGSQGVSLTQPWEISSPSPGRSVIPPIRLGHFRDPVWLVAITPAVPPNCPEKQDAFVFRKSSWVGNCLDDTKTCSWLFAQGKGMLVNPLEIL